MDALAGVAVTNERFAALVTGEASEELVACTYAGLFELLQASFRSPEGTYKKRTYEEDLAYLKIPAEFAVSIAKEVFSSRRAEIDLAALENRIKLPGLKSFKWRVDVAISTSSLKRALKPSVLMQMTLDNGRIHTFEMPVDQFHKLRYNVAFVLKEIEDLEKRPAMQVP